MVAGVADTPSVAHRRKRGASTDAGPLVGLLFGLALVLFAVAAVVAASGLSC